MTTDGETAELLSQRFIKELDILPELTVFLRCSLHALTRSLENALKSDKHCNDVLEMFVLKFAGLQKGQHGAFARAIRNSDKLKHKFGEEVAKAVEGIANEVAELGAICSKATKRGGSINMSNSLARFSSWLHILVKVCYWGRAVMWFLWQTSVAGGPSSTWAREVLQFMTERTGSRGMANCILLALIAEFTAACRKAITKFDHNKNISGTPGTAGKLK